jgi:murein DD-endopeptidase MepM/ murein hydrolase activator NlpD
MPVPTSTPLLTPTASLLPTQTPIVIPTSTLSPCLARASFGDPAESLYILPYPVGQSHRVTQTYCDPDGSHANQLAYDFEIPIGADITAARAGEVRVSRDDIPDVDSWEYYEDQFNFIFIQHKDKTAAFYAHLKQDSIVVQYGEYVETGQRIAASGNSGIVGAKPHLHFGVYGSYPPGEGFDVPVNFRNADGKLDARGGLMKGKYYEALPY